jgi:hypothetical protein
MPYKDPEKAKQNRRKYYRKYREKIIARAIAWNKESAERRKDILAKWNNKNSTKKYKRLWHERKRFGKEHLLENATECQLCGVKEDLLIHHSGNNCYVLCRKCHPTVHNQWWMKELEGVVPYA